MSVEKILSDIKRNQKNVYFADFYRTGA